MTVVSIASLRSAASDVLNREELDRLLTLAGDFDKDEYEEHAEYEEQILLARALRDRQQREQRREIARARRPRFF